MSAPSAAPPMKRLALLFPLLALGACNKADNAPGPGGVTVGEARALDAAAEMIESEAPPTLPLTSPTSASASPAAS